MAKVKVKFLPATVLKWLVVFSVILLVLDVVAIYISLEVEKLRPFQVFFIRLFDFNQEGNIPSFFSSLLLLVASALLFLVAFTEKLSVRNYLGWIGLGIVFAFLAMDEAASIHEFFIGFFRETFNLSGYLYYAWVIPYGIGLLVMAFVYLPFFLKLEVRMFKLMILSGLIFVAGAVGLEMLGGKSFEEKGLNPELMILYTIEEELEMLGVSVFIYSLLWYLSASIRKFSFVLTPKTVEAVSISKSRTVQDTLRR